MATETKALHTAAGHLHSLPDGVLIDVLSALRPAEQLPCRTLCRHVKRAYAERGVADCLEALVDSWCPRALWNSGQRDRIPVPPMLLPTAWYCSDHFPVPGSLEMFCYLIADPTTPPTSLLEILDRAIGHYRPLVVWPSSPLTAVIRKWVRHLETLRGISTLLSQQAETTLATLAADVAAMHTRGIRVEGLAAVTSDVSKGDRAIFDHFAASGNLVCFRSEPIMHLLSENSHPRLPVPLQALLACIQQSSTLSDRGARRHTIFFPHHAVGSHTLNYSGGKDAHQRMIEELRAIEIPPEVVLQNLANSGLLKVPLTAPLHVTILTGNAVGDPDMCKGQLFHTLNLESVILPLNSPGLASCCPELRHVTMPVALRQVPEQMLRSCAKLQEVLFDKCPHLHEIGRCAFEWCPSLERILFPRNLRNISIGAFRGAGRVRVIDLRQAPHLEFIGKMCFSDCPLLAQIHLPDSVKGIGEQAFAMLPSLEAVHLGSFLSELTSIGMRVFEACPKLREICFPPRLEHLGTVALSCSSLALLDLSACALLCSVAPQIASLYSADTIVRLHPQCERLRSTFCGKVEISLAPSLSI
jgi:hypothetical protein